MEKDHFIRTENDNGVFWNHSINKTVFQTKDRHSGFGPLLCPTKRRGNEQRIRNRFKMEKEVFAIIRSHKMPIEHENEMTMAEIAVSVYNSHPIKLGRLKNISTNGLCMSYIEYSTTEAGPLELDLLVIKDHFFIDGISFEVVYDIESKTASFFDDFKVRLLGIAFNHLSAVQISWIHRLVQLYAGS